MPSGLCSQPTSLPGPLPLKPLREEGLSSEWDGKVQLGSPNHRRGLLKCLPGHPYGLAVGETHAASGWQRLMKGLIIPLCRQLGLHEESSCQPSTRRRRVVSVLEPLKG